MTLDTTRLKVVDSNPGEKDEIFQEIFRILPELDGFLILGIKNNHIIPIKFQISNVEMVYAAEYVKSKIFTEGGISLD